MPSTWTTDQILALAPDASSAKAGQGVATPRKWSSLGCDERAAWGECQGSAKDPYRAQIDLSEPAFHCTCPSRKFPCKHTLGLFLLLATQPSAFSRREPPEWVADWLAGRTLRQQHREKHQVNKWPAADPSAQARRVAGRHAKVTAGLHELEIWLGDLVRQGLAWAQSQPPHFWDSLAARMVDAQAPGVARLIRDIAASAACGDRGQERLLERAGRLHLLLEGFKRLDTLPPGTQADVRALIGWTIDQDKLLAQTGISDRWLVMGQRVDEEDRLRVQRTWLWGCASGRAALVLHFAHKKQPLDTSLLPGTCLDAELVFYPGAYPLRALKKSRNGIDTFPDRIPGYAGVAAAMQAYSMALGQNPWLEEFPLALGAVTPVRLGESWAVRDPDGIVLPLVPRFEHAWRLMALSGGHPVAMFGEWDGDHVLPLSVSAEGRFVHLGTRNKE